jgi:ceramide glucosyltransferase
MLVLAWIAAIVAGAGILQAFAGYLAVRRFRAIPESLATELPGITVLKPLYGDEPLLETALASICLQDYPRCQVIFGVQDPNDTARPVAERVRARFPGRDIVVMVDDTADGANRKVANLMNMLPAARHDVLVIADSDIHAAPDYLRRIATALAQPCTGLVTTLYTGLQSNRTVVADLGATAITHGFLPGALLARALGRQDCLGATMALRRETLAAIGGFAALVNHLADDHVLGHLVRAQGLQVRLASAVPATTVAESRFTDLFRHELRWGRTIQTLAPLEFALSAVQFPLAWALLAVLLSDGQEWALAVLLSAWAGRAALARAIDAALGPSPHDSASPTPVWLLPLRDFMSVAVLLASYASDRVEWRGRTMRTDRRRRGYPVASKASATAGS